MSSLRDQIVDKLRHMAPDYEAARIWGRFPDTPNDVGAAGNAWAGSVEDVADEIMTVIEANKEDAA